MLIGHEGSIVKLCNLINDQCSKNDQINEILEKNQNWQSFKNHKLKCINDLNQVALGQLPQKQMIQPDQKVQLSQGLKVMQGDDDGPEAEIEFERQEQIQPNFIMRNDSINEFLSKKQAKEVEIAQQKQEEDKNSNQNINQNINQTQMEQYNQNKQQLLQQNQFLDLNPDDLNEDNNNQDEQKFSEIAQDQQKEQQNQLEYQLQNQLRNQLIIQQQQNVDQNEKKSSEQSPKEQSPKKSPEQQSKIDEQTPEKLEELRNQEIRNQQLSHIKFQESDLNVINLIEQQQIIDTKNQSNTQEQHLKENTSPQIDQRSSIGSNNSFISQNSSFSNISMTSSQLFFQQNKIKIRQVKTQKQEKKVRKINQNDLMFINSLNDELERQSSLSNSQIEIKNFDQYQESL